MENELHLELGKDLYPQIYSYYKNKILYGEYKAGDKLPTYSAMCNRYAVSLTTVKKAYQQLEREGYISLSLKGSFVKERGETVAEALSRCLGADIENALAFGAAKEDISAAIETILEKYC